MFCFYGLFSLFLRKETKKAIFSLGIKHENTFIEERNKKN